MRAFFAMSSPSKMNLLKILLCFFVLFNCTASYSQEESKFRLGADIGPGIISDGVGTGVGFGLQFKYFGDPRFGFGVKFNYYGKSQIVLMPIRGSVEFVPFDNKFRPYLNVDMGVYLGRQTGSQTQPSSSNFGIAPGFGAYMSVTKTFDLHFSFQYHIVSGGFGVIEDIEGASTILGIGFGTVILL